MATSKTIGFSKTVDGTKENIGTVNFNMPESVEEAVKMWGEDVVLSNVNASVTVAVQAVARKFDDVEKAQEAVSKYTPGIKASRGGGVSKSALAKLLGEMQKTDPEKYAEIVASIPNAQA